MTVRELITLLFRTQNLDVKVTASDTYNEGTFPITGIIYNNDGVELTSENNE